MSPEKLPNKRSSTQRKGINLQVFKRMRAETSRVLVGTLLLSQLFAAVDGAGWTGRQAFADSLPSAAAGTAGASTGSPAQTAAASATTSSPAQTAASAAASKAADFTDIGSSYAAAEIKALAEAGIVSGYENGQFSPANPMTRAELAKIIAMSLGLSESPESAAKFADVAADSWYRGYVGALVKSGITQGTSDTEFSPNKKVTREELVVLFVRAMGLDETARKLPSEPVFGDWAAISDWAKPSVAVAGKIGFVQGMESADGKLVFNPGAAAERQALARLAYEFYKNKEQYVSAAHKLVQPAEEPKPETPAVAGGGGGGGGGGGYSGGNNNNNNNGGNQPQINQAGATIADYRIDSSGTFGPADNSAVVTVTGTLTVDPGPTGQVTLQNINAAKIEILSGSPSTIKTRRTQSGRVVLNAGNQTDSVRLLAQEGTTISSTEVQSKAIIESESADTGTINVTGGAANQTIVLRGSFPGGITFGAAGGSLKFEAPSNGGQTNVSTIQITAAGASLEVGGGVTLGRVVLSERVKLTGDPTAISNMTVEVTGSGSLEADESTLSVLRTGMIRKTIEAIDAIVPAAEYTEERDQLLSSLRGMVKAVFMLGAQQADVTNLQKLADAEANLIDLALAKAKNTLQIGFGFGDSNEKVTQNVSLAIGGLAGTTISWETSDASRLTKDGIVTRPAVGLPDAVVRLTATIERQGKSVYKTFSVTVKALHVNGTEPSAAPSVTGTVYTHAAWISGNAEPNSQIMLTDAADHLVGKASANESGGFIVPLRRVLTGGEALKLVAEAPGKLTSEATSINVITANTPTRITAQPEIDEDIYADTTSLAIKAYEPLVVWFKQEDEVIDAKYIGTNSSKYDSFYYSNLMTDTGIFSPSGSGGGFGGSTSGGGSSGASIEIDLTTKFEPGKKITITGKTNGKNESGPINKTVREVSGKTSNPVINGKTYRGEFTLQTSVDIGSTVNVYVNGHQAKIISATTVQTIGSNEIQQLNFSEALESNTVELSAKAKGKTVSDKVVVNLEELTEVSTKPIINKSTVEGFVRGVAPSNSIVEIRDGNGVIYRSTSSFNTTGFGTFDYSFVYSSSAAEETLYITAKEPFKQKSEAVPVTIRRAAAAWEDNSNKVRTDTPVLRSDSIYETGGSIELEPSSERRFIKFVTANGTLLASQMLQPNQSWLDVKFSLPFSVDPGQQLFVTAIETGKAQSQPIVIIIKQISTAPNLQLRSIYIGQGEFILTGNVELKASVVVKKASDGRVIAGPVIQTNSNILFLPFATGESVELVPGEKLEVTAQREGRPEKTVTINVPNDDKTASFTIKNDRVYESGGAFEVLLNSPSGSRVVVKDDKGNIVFTGEYTTNRPKIAVQNVMGSERLTVYVAQSNLLFSNPEFISIQPDSARNGLTTDPQVNTILDQSVNVSGIAEAFSRVFVWDADYRLLGSGLTYGDGAYSINVDRLLTSEEVVHVSVLAVGKTMSSLTSVPVSPGIKSKKPVVSSGTVTDESKKVSFIVESAPSNLLVVLDSSGYMVGMVEDFISMAEVYYDGFKAGENYTVINKATGKLWSDPRNITVQEAPTTSKPTVTGTIYDAVGSNLLVTAEYGSVVYIKKEGQYLYQLGTVYSTPAQINVSTNYARIAGDVIYLTVKAAGKKESEAVPLTVMEAPLTATPTVTSTIYSESTTIKGTAESGATVKLLGLDGHEYGQGLALESTGVYTINVYYTPLPLDEPLQIVAKRDGYKNSIPLPVTVQESPKTATPTVTGQVYADGYNLQLSGESGASVYLKLLGGTSVASSTFYSGQTKMNWYYDFADAQQVKVTAKLSGSRESDPVLLTVQPLSGKTAAPIVEGNVYSTYAGISFNTEPNAKVVIKRPSLGDYSYYADDNGRFTYDVGSIPVPVGEVWTITVDAMGKTISDPVTITVKPLP